ncbi:SDR family oxidoreductase [Sorangium sp. So ce1504]|uniref:NAD(P)-dependent oxidoreductase n=1 Tax=Sorangium sp. So ce1504 TaxID=3133337 RepID=UPI003F5F29E4
MKLVIFGANGPVGLLLVRQALDKGHTVTAVTRRASSFPIAATERLTVMQGDVLRLEDVERAVAGQDAVLSTFGVPFTRKPVTVYTEGITNIIAAMKAAGVRRIVAVTSGGTRPGIDWKDGIFFSIVLKSFIGKTLYEDQRRMENILMSSGLAWTIARPARLVDTPQVTHYRVEEAYVVKGGSRTSRRDLADFMLEHASRPDQLGKAVAIGTFD